ncbi:MotA/TolQ/ExbB proton channel family protein, partial [Campylobacter fetus]|uniref:MotA/TolQ/ExbB proton channel family protein n=1 Tax=Campylobacter fetus TaxID=196 RepID=UPI001F07371A
KKLSFVDIGRFKSTKSLEMALTKNLTFLYVIYSNAPYVGLLGTVLAAIICYIKFGFKVGFPILVIFLFLNLNSKTNPNLLPFNVELVN